MSAGPWIRVRKGGRVDGRDGSWRLDDKMKSHEYTIVNHVQIDIFLGDQVRRSYIRLCWPI